MEDLSLNDQVKAAERDKYLAEAEKAKSEKEQIDYDLKQSKRFFNFKTIWSVILGLSFLGFFINYVVVPSYNRENIELATKNAITSDSLFKQKGLLEEKALALFTQKRLLEEKSLVLKKQKDTLTAQSHQILIVKKKYDTLSRILAKIQLTDKNRNLRETIKAIDEVTKSVSQIVTSIPL